MGSIRKHHSSKYSIRYYDHTRKQREEYGFKTKTAAKRVLALREGSKARGEPVTPGHMEFAEAVGDVITHYEVNGLRSLPDAKRRIDKHLLPHFGRRRMTSITTACVRTYQAERQAEGASNGSINREVGLVRRAFRLAQQAGKLHHRPHTPMLKEAPPRQGFLERAQYEAIHAALPTELRGILVLGYWSGWRKSEILRLEWRQVDRDAQVIRLAPGTTKSGAGRALPYGLVPELVDAIEGQWEAHKTLRANGVICPTVFHRDGMPVRSFARAWKSACKAAGVPGTLVHDLRRTAARNLIRSGVNEKLAMEILGHKTPSIFARYNITTENDMRDALGTLAAATRGKQGGLAKSARAAGSSHGA